LPPVFYDLYPQTGKISFTDMLNSEGGRIVLLGVLVCLFGIFLCGRAGMLKERELSEETKKETIQEFNMVKGLIVAIISGVLSACFNFGIEAGKPMADAANSLWKAANPTETTEFLFQNNVTYVVLLWGGLTTNLIWCTILNARNKTFGDYANAKTPLLKNYIFSAIAGTTWFLQFFFYGMGESKLGNGASSWILHMAFIILIANMWGLLLKEWTAVSKKTFTTFILGISTIIISVLLVGYGNSI
jgi:L-rhamnose-H+ transport protein